MSIVTSLVAEVSKEVIKLVSGKVLTENQIQGISKHVVGRYFADLLTRFGGMVSNSVRAKDSACARFTSITDFKVKYFLDYGSCLC
jgi:hypothetical protein